MKKEVLDGVAFSFLSSAYAKVIKSIKTRRRMNKEKKIMKEKELSHNVSSAGHPNFTMVDVGRQ
jgi:hypothetical protein